MIQEVVALCGGISRRELAHIVCQLLEWKRPNDRLKARECRDLLELLESKGELTLPEKKRKGKTSSQKIIPEIPRGQSHCILSGSVEEFTPPLKYGGFEIETRGICSRNSSVSIIIWDMPCPSPLFVKKSLKDDLMTGI